MSYDENWIVECIHALKGHVMNFQPANIFKKTGCIVFWGSATNKKLPFSNPMFSKQTDVPDFILTSCATF